MQTAVHGTALTAVENIPSATLKEEPASTQHHNNTDTVSTERINLSSCMILTQMTVYEDDTHWRLSDDSGGDETAPCTPLWRQVRNTVCKSFDDVSIPLFYIQSCGSDYTLCRYHLVYTFS